ncbi:carbon-nitrogen hydrolase family protein [Slackia heliotrinireducens]|uniref:carbon-nitrogen hydrolase family protein n=1 Tax=Slackia heliotrinireducens TaxID=84110 RepID=UPI0033152345
MPTIATVQFDVHEDAEANYRTTLHYIKQAAEQGADIVCFPEGQLGPYVPQYQGLSAGDFAIPITHPYVEGIRAVCRDNDIIGCFGLCLELDGDVYACAVLIDEHGDILGIQKKHHIVYAPHFYERDYFTPGDEGFQVYDTRAGRIGMIVCFDRHFPESFRTLALKGAQFVYVPVANEKVEPCEVFQWEIRVPAFQNSLYALMANRVGTEGAMDFCGESILAGPDGNPVFLGDDSEQMLVGQMDFGWSAQLREQKQYLPIRRPEVFDLG